MFFSVSVFARRGALAAAGILLATAIAGCQGTQSAPTAQPTPAASSSQSAGQAFGGQLPAELPQDPAAGFGSVEIIQGTTITLSVGRGGFPVGQAPNGQAPGSETPRARNQGGQGQSGQAQRGQLQGGQGQAFLGSGSASVVSLEPGTKYFKGVFAAPSGTPGPQNGNPAGAPPSGTPQPGSGTQNGAPPSPDAAQRNGGRGDRQFAMTVEPATVADIQVGSLVMVWGSVIDGRVYADVVYILSAGPGGRAGQ